MQWALSGNESKGRGRTGGTLIWSTGASEWDVLQGVLHSPREREVRSMGWGCAVAGCCPLAPCRSPVTFATWFPSNKLFGPNEQMVAGYCCVATDVPLLFPLSMLS